MLLQPSRSSSPSCLSMANDLAVQFHNYLRGSDVDSTALGAWTVSRMTVNYSDRPIPSRSCEDHEYLIIEVSNQHDDLLRLRLDHTRCSTQIFPSEVDRALNRHSLQGSLPEPRSFDLGAGEDDGENPFGPSNTPAFRRASISVSPVPGLSEGDLCLRQICFQFFSDVDSASGQSSHSTAFDFEDEDLGSISSISGIDDTFVNDFTLLDLAQLISSESVKEYHFEEKKLVPICHSSTFAITEALRQREYPVIENDSVFKYDGDEPVGGDVVETSSICTDFYDHTMVADIETECLLTERRILALNLRLSMADVALSGANVKLFNLQHPAYKIDLAGQQISKSGDDVLELK